MQKKNWRQPRPVTRPRMQRKRRVAADDLAFSLLSLCPPKRIGASLDRHRVHLANFFFAKPSALFVAAPTTTAGPLSPPFLQPSKMAVSANYFLCRPFAWLASLLVIIYSFFATVKNYQPNLIMHTFFVWRDLHLSHGNKQGVPFKICGFLLLIG